MSSDKLRERLEFMRVNAETRQALGGAKGAIEKGPSIGLDQFYDQIRREPSVSRFFSGEQHIDGAKSAQARHWMRIASGEFSDDYMASVQRIGETHARIGLKPQWYIGGYGLILDQLVRAVVTEKTKTRGPFGKFDSDDLADSLGALVKAALIDMDLAISVYLDTSERERLRLEAESKAAEEAQRLVVTSLATGLAKLAGGDLWRSVRPKRRKRSKVSSTKARAKSKPASILSAARAMRWGRSCRRSPKSAGWCPTFPLRLRNNRARWPRSTPPLTRWTRPPSRTRRWSKRAQRPAIRSRTRPKR